MRKIILLFFGFALISELTLSQSTRTPNTWGLTTDFLGWDATTGSPPLLIKTTNPDPINFRTNNNPRMQIYESGTGATNDGFVGIGDFLTFTPKNMLHIHNTAFGTTAIQLTNGVTGSAATSGLKISMTNNISEIYNQQPGPIILKTNDVLGTPNERIRIFTNFQNGTEVTRVMIPILGSAFPNRPASLLHLGQNWAPGTAGHRLWMDVGMFTIAGTDLGYFGLKNENPILDNYGSDNMDAVIGFGDNFFNGTDNGNNLRFIFTSIPGGGESSNFNGLEVGRMTWEGNTGFGNFTQPGAGNGSGIQPIRKVEIYDVHQNDARAAAPQLRLTYTPNATVGLGIHTDFQNTSLGNLIIVTENGGNIANTGIGNFFSAGSTVEPKRRLDVYDQGEDEPQLRLTYTADPLVSNGKWTDFQTTSSGDLFINPMDNATPRKVGINTSTPNATLEINSNDGSASPGNSGLVLTDLKANTSTIQATSFTGTRGVLSIDANGKVKLVEDIGGGSVNAFCSPGPDIVARFDPSNPNNLQCTNIYNNFAAAIPKIGFFTTLPQYKFQNEGTALFTNNAVTAPINLYATSTAPLMVNSYNENEGLSILHRSTAITQKDLFKIYADNGNATYPNSPLYHFRTQKLGGYPGYGNVSFDHEAPNNSAVNEVSSWLGYNTYKRFAVMKDDFNTNYFAPAIAAFGGSVITGNHAKFYIEAQRRDFSDNQMTYGLVVNNSNGKDGDGYRSAIFGYMEVVRTRDRVSNRAGMFFATGATGDDASNLGVYGVAQGTGQGSINMGGRFTAYKDGSRNYGVYCEASDGKDMNYGIYAYVPSSSCASGGPCTSAAGFFNGDVYCTTGNYYSSDATLKTNIQPFSGDSLLRTVPIHTFDFLTQNNFDLTLPQGNHFGVLAQEVEQILPNFVKTFKQPEQVDSIGNVISQAKDIKAVNYNEFIPLLISAYQKQANDIDSLKAALGILQPLRKANIDNSGNNTGLSVELENIHAIVLNQNEPNPFAEQTTITWNVTAPEKGALDAVIMFYDNTGSILKTVKINEAGAGSLLVYGSKLSSGIYTYSLVVNGKTIDSKRMVKTK